VKEEDYSIMEREYSKGNIEEFQKLLKTFEHY